MEDSRAGTRPRSDDPHADPTLTRLVEDLDEGFAVLVRHEERVVYSVALRVTGAHQDAEDLAAETFLRAYRALLGYDGERIRALRLRPWLLTIAINTWRNSLRSASRHPAAIPTAELPEPRSDGRGVEQAAESAETQRELGALLARLPAPQRAAVVLRHVAGMSIGEVAEVLGCPEGTAKSHVSRGLASLRTIHRNASPAGRRAI
ncbi:MULTISPECIES: RNA polymerase sigma factor [Actinokineospora]|nr:MULTISPECIES: RNA polymerase sigma factor [Actinokineospora]UVS81447.1 Sigma-W factor [Actinokineospora sp. UTMC 2448]